MATISYIHWRDASRSVDDTELSEVSPVDVHSVGFVVKEDAESVALSVEDRQDASYTRIWICIPKVNIIERRDMPLGRAFPKRKTKTCDAPTAELKPTSRPTD